MEKMFVLFLAALTFGACLCQDEESQKSDSEPVSGIETAACVFGCLESFQRKGVDGESPAVMDMGTGVCENLDLDALIKMCTSYGKADTCLGGCVNTPTKRVIMNGLDYMCTRHLDDFKKYMPCFKQNCAQLEQQCGKQCGIDLSSAQEQWMTELGVNGSAPAEETSSRRRRRQASDSEPDADTTSESVTTTTEEYYVSSGDADSTDPINTCQIVRCYVNCSRPILETACGKDAYELLKTTSNILLSFVMVPLEETWEAGTNTSLSEPMNMCDGYFSQALTAEGVDKNVLKSSATYPSFNSISSILLFAWALLLTIQLQ